MRAWLQQLAPRERLVLGSGAAAAAVIVLWGFVWMPLTSGTSELEAAVERKRALVAALRRAAALEGDATAEAASTRGAARSLVVLVDETAQSRGLASNFTATRPDGRDAINVSFQTAAFDVIVDWLLALERDYGVRVESASFNSAGERGLVTGQLLLRRA